MNIIQEMIHEAKQQTHVKVREYGKRLIIFSSVLSSLLAITFYVFGIPQSDSFYHDVPLFLGIPLLAMGLFNAVSFILIFLFFLESLGVVTNLTVRSNREYQKKTERRENSKAIYDAFNAFGQKDFSLQIDEKQKGNDYKFSEIRTDLNEWKKFINELAQRVSIKSFITDLRVYSLEKKVTDLTQKLENRIKNTVPIEEFEKVTSRLLKMEEELRKLKGE
jgi:hypothetical protein